MALGASPASITVLILPRGVTLSAARLIAGLAIASFGSKVLDSMLFGLTHTGALTHGTGRGRSGPRHVNRRSPTCIPRREDRSGHGTSRGLE